MNQMPALKEVIKNKISNHQSLHISNIFFIFKPIQHNLLHRVFELYKKFMTITTVFVIPKACQLTDKFCDRSPRVELSCMHRFLEKWQVQYCIKTHKSQQLLLEMTQEEIIFEQKRYDFQILITSS